MTTEFSDLLPGAGDVLSFPVSPGVLTSADIRDFLGQDNPVILNVGANRGQSTVDMLLAMRGATVLCV